jgi:uncharacterized protein with GYD domain
MAKYISLGRFRGATDFTQAPTRVEKVKQVLASLGGKLESVQYTLGSYDFVVTMDLPNEEALAAFSAWYGKLGVAEADVMPAFSLEQMVAASSRIKQ